jgi:hypothetical protein
MRIVSYKLLAFAAMVLVGAVAYTAPPQATTPVSHIVVNLPDQNGIQRSLDLEVRKNELIGVTQVGTDGVRLGLQPKSDPASSPSSCGEGTKQSCWEDANQTISICMCVPLLP